MSNIVDDAEKAEEDKDWINGNEIQGASTTELSDGSFQEQGGDEQDSELFWSGAVTTMCHQQHPRVSTLKTQVEFQYKFENGRVYVRALRYHMTTRSGNWYRANIRLYVESGSNWSDRNSPDEMSQDTQWHNYPTKNSSDLVDTSLGSPGGSVHMKIRVDYDGTDNDVEPDEGWGEAVYLAQTPIVLSPPSGAIVNTPFNVTGKNGLKNGTIHLYPFNGVIPFASTPVRSDGSWDVSVTLPVGIKSFYARQVIGTKYSGPSNVVTIKRAVAAPQINKPSSNETVDLRPIISGTGVDGSTVKVWQTNPYRVLIPSVLVGANSNWSKQSEVALEAGPVTIRAQATLDEVDSPETPDRTFTARLNSPGITSPAPGSTQDTTFTIGGNLGQSGTIVRVLIDHSDPLKEVGRSHELTGASWNAVVTVEPGPSSLVAQQFKGQLDSPLSTARAFKIRPPALTKVDVGYPTDNTIKFSGAGYPGATVEITKVSGPEVLPLPGVEVGSDGQWEVTATGWPFGTYTLSAIQKVSDNANGWIPSQTFQFSFTRAVPDPSEVTYTKDYRPTFSGKGYTGATVKFFNSGGASYAAPEALVSAGQWSSRASEEWGPTLERLVHIKQYMGTQSSPNWVILKVTIPPLAPGLNPPVENGLSPQFNGKCWPGATVNIKFSDSVTVHPVTGTNGTWEFRRATPFAVDVTHSVMVTQTAAEQTSPSVSATFVVYAPIPKPVITDPAADSEVGRDVTVQGENGMAGATMQLRDAQFGRDLGEPKVLTRDGRWSIDLVELGFRRYTIDAQQTRNQRPSERSDPLVVEVVLLPPVINEPLEKGDSPRTSTLSGWGMAGGQVDILQQGVEEPFLPNIPVGPDGRWTVETTLPVGAKTIRARQTYDGRTSKDSQPRNYNVVPRALNVETPISGECVGQWTVVSGFGVPGDSVKVILIGATRRVLGQAPVLEDRTWSVKVELNLVGGHYVLVAVASCDGFDSADSPGRPVVLGTYRPSIDAPTPGQWVTYPFSFKGQGRPGSGQVVSWFNPEQKWTPVMGVTGAGWQGQASRALPQGGNWCRFRQSITDNADGATVSDWVESERFESVPPAKQP